MRSFRIHNAIFLAGFALVGCVSEPVTQEVPAPKIVAVMPAKVLKAENEVIALTFSQPVINNRNLEACVRFAKTQDVSIAQVQRAAKMPKSETFAPFINASVTLSETRQQIYIKPIGKLEYNAEYSLWIFDCLRGNTGQVLALEDESGTHSVFHFRAEDGPFVLVSHNVILQGNLKVPPNRKHFSFVFSHPIRTAAEGSVKIGDVFLDLTLSEDKKTLYASLPEGKESCERMQPDVTHKVVLSGLQDETLRSLAETVVEFQTEQACVLNKSSVLKNLQVQAYEAHVDIRFDALNLAFVHLKYANEEHQVVQRLKTRESTLRIENLLENANYQYELEAEDLFGQRVVVQGEFQTRPVAQIAVNEIMATPNTKKGQTDSNSEFIELYNYGDVAVDLSGFKVEVGSRTCPLLKKVSLSSIVLPPKSYLLLVGKKFDPMNVGLNDDPAIIRMSGQTICGNLRNWPIPVVRLRDESGRVVDQFLGMQEPKEKGYSIERLNPAQKNGKEQFCYSRSDVGPTPLRANGVAEKGCMHGRS